MVTDTFLPDSMEPQVLLDGAPAQADYFLLSTLWGPEGTLIPVFQVLGWMEILRHRGADFASHAAVCQYWLYEHVPDVPALLHAWKWERLARNTVARSAVALARQQTLVSQLRRHRIQESTAVDTLDSMQKAFGVFCEIWAMHAKTLDGLLGHTDERDPPSQPGAVPVHVAAEFNPESAPSARLEYGGGPETSPAGWIFNPSSTPNRDDRCPGHCASGR
ncbi:hypothetical protein [Paraburkholderia nodosa]|uniref:hypothetical protein n=1 Tax=Paraburkholderia nodosa TaxID=392320 RepID=UPI0008418875|nr:hypothetical protein [Paraburkholderia nodosa]